MHKQNAQNQGPQANQQFFQAQNQNNTQFETGSELTQSTGEISRLLATQKLIGLEIGGIGQTSQNQSQYPNQNQFQNQYTNQNQNYQSNAQLEVDQATGPLSQSLSQQSRPPQQ